MYPQTPIPLDVKKYLIKYVNRKNMTRNDLLQHNYHIQLEQNQLANLRLIFFHELLS